MVTALLVIWGIGFGLSLGWGIVCLLFVMFFGPEPKDGTVLLYILRSALWPIAWPLHFAFRR